MRIPVALLLAVSLAIGVPAAAGARGVPTQATTTTATAAASGSTVTLTISVTADDEPVPEGTVTLTEGGTDLGAVPLADGTATWSATTTPGEHTYDVAYTPADGRWLASEAESVTVTVEGPCGRRCGPAYTIRIRAPRHVAAGKRAKILVEVISRPGRPASGWARIELSGPRGDTWKRRTELPQGRATFRTRRMHRVGKYQVLARVHVDGGHDSVGSTTLRVKERS